MKRILLTMLLVTIARLMYGQTIYYWVGGANPTSIHTNSNWNTMLDGSGSARASSSNTSDILIFDGSNIGGGTPATGLVSGPVDGGISCAQLKLVNNANVKLGRTSATGTVTIAGDSGPDDDFVIESGSTLTLGSTTGSVRIAMAASNTGRVSGNFAMISSVQARIDNTTGGSPGSLRFTSGSTFTTNITGSSTSYAFGSSSQSSPKWVVFEAGSHLYYEGGHSPHGSGNLFSAIDMQPGSTWHHRATNVSPAGGNFFNRQSYGNIIVENDATLNASNSIYYIENLTIEQGCTFNTAASGYTVVTGQLVVNGSLLSNTANPYSNELILAGSAPQTVSGTGTINVASLVIADNANVSLAKNIAVEKMVAVYGKLNLNNSQISGNATFDTKAATAPVAATGNLVAGTNYIIGNVGVPSSSRFLGISGTGIAPNTSILFFSNDNDTIYLSDPVTSSGTGMALTVEGNGATLETAHPNGFDPATGSVTTTGDQNFEDGINYVINGATTWPFGVSTNMPPFPLVMRSAVINAPVTINRSIYVRDQLSVNGKILVPAGDSIRIIAGGVINGNYNAGNYIATGANTATGELGIVQYNGMSAATTIPVGTADQYMPVTITPSSSSDFIVGVFEGITADGTVNGAALTPAQKQRLVDAVWNIDRISGSGTADIQLEWATALEGSTFLTLPSTDIGLITNTGSSWADPVGTADNTTNTVTTTLSSFGAIGVGAVAPTVPFTFNPIPDKIYGDADFNGGASSLNTTQPIVYTSSDPTVATIVAGNIHITGVGTTTITASQATDGLYPAVSVDQPLTVTKAGLIITADNKTRFEGLPNPTLTLTYSGFVYGETPAVLLTPAVVTTMATTASAPGPYPITVSGATAANYNITFVDGTLTVVAKQTQTITFNALPTKTYGNADFSANATSTNNTIPITYTSSNPDVATVNASGIIHITGGGTTTITASQAGSDGYFPAADVSRTLTVNKANLTIRVLDTVKVQGEPNPVFTMTYTGFVLGETVADLDAPPTVSTLATTTSTAGVYTLTPQGAVTNKYNITYTDGRLTIYPLSGREQPYIHAFVSSSNTLTVRVYSTYPELGDITLYDLNGRPLLKKNVFLPQGFINANVNISMIPAGIYVVTVRGGGVNLKKTIPIIR